MQSIYHEDTKKTSYGFQFVLAHPFCEKEHVFPQGQHAVDRKCELSLVSDRDGDVGSVRQNRHRPPFLDQTAGDGNWKCLWWCNAHPSSDGQCPSYFAGAGTSDGGTSRIQILLYLTGLPWNWSWMGSFAAWAVYFGGESHAVAPSNSKWFWTKTPFCRTVI
jgi:hypothetical protein